MGVQIDEIDDEPLPLEPIVWAKAKELSFSVEDAFKVTPPESLAVYLPDPDPNIWTHVETTAGDVFLVKPRPLEALLAKLQPGDRGLFFIRTYPGSDIPVIYKARLGQQSLDDLAKLRTNRANPNISIAQIVAQAEAQRAALARQEAAEFRALEDDYYKILRIQDLDIRASLLNDLIERMGFEGHWSYFEFKDRYLKEHGAHIGDDAVPSGPSEGKEKLWHDISGELRKIEVIKKARER
jgi:hypothetical protein